MREKLIKEVNEHAPELLDLAKQAHEALTKVELEKHEAKVALCLDISGTMHSLYVSGKLQKFAERILALAVLFDDDNSIDVFLFGGGDTHYVGEMNLENFHDFIGKAHKKHTAIGGTYYGKAMQHIRNFYFPHEGKGEHDQHIKNKEPAVVAEEPVYVMFVTDGTTADEHDTINQLVWSSYEPIFWQFMAIGQSQEDAGKGFWGWINKAFAQDFSFLTQLDNMEGRNIDNACFFNVKDPVHIDDDKLFHLLMTEYPEWVVEAEKHGLLIEKTE